MAEEFVCDICGKHLKTAAGLAGHRMFAHPEPRTLASEAPEEALAELLSSVRDAYNRLESRLEDFGSQVKSLVAQLSTVDGRLDGFESGMVERLQSAESGKEQAESAAEAAQGELEQWQRGELHLKLRELWDLAVDALDVKAYATRDSVNIQGIIPVDLVTIEQTSA